MKIQKHIKKIIAIGVGAIFIGATLVGCVQQPEVSLTQAQYNAALDTKYNAGVSSVNIKSDNAGVIAKAVIDAKASVDITSDNAQAIAAATKRKNNEIAKLKKVIADAKEVEAEVDDIDADGYNLDELEIGVEFSFTVSDRQLSGLFDGEVTLDGDEYDAEEIIDLIKFKVANNYEDEYKADTYLQIPEGFRYMMKFEAGFDTLLISEDETLVFNFLGDEYEASNWNGDTITFTKGTIEELTEGRFKIVDGRKITLVAASDGYVKVSVDGVGKKIWEGDTEKINGIEVRATEIYASESWRLGGATLKIGEDVSFKVSDGDEYEADERWDWAVDSNSIAIVLNEEFLSVEEDEDYNALAAGESFSLPNDYANITYNGLGEEDTEKYTFELDTKNGAEYIEAKGDFLKGLEDYNRIYINASGFYDKDLELIDTTSIDFANAEIGNNVPLTLDIVGTDLVFDNVVLGLNLASITIDGDSIATEEEDYLTNYGIVINSPEDSVEDQEFKIVMPDEKLEASLTITRK